MSNHSLPARGTDPPFSHKSVVSIAHQRNVVCNITLICRQLFAGQVVTSRPMKRKEKNTSNDKKNFLSIPRNIYMTVYCKPMKSKPMPWRVYLFTHWNTGCPALRQSLTTISLLDASLWHPLQRWEKLLYQDTYGLSDCKEQQGAMLSLCHILY